MSDKKTAKPAAKAEEKKEPKVTAYVGGKVFKGGLPEGWEDPWKKKDSK